MYVNNLQERNQYKNMYEENMKLMKACPFTIIFWIQFFIILLFSINIWQLSNAKKVLSFMEIPFNVTLIIFIISELVAFTYLIMNKMQKANPLMAAFFMFTQVSTMMELMKIAGVSAVISDDKTIGFSMFVYVSVGIGLFWLIIAMNVVIKYNRGFYAVEVKLDKARVKHVRFTIAIWCILAIPIIPFGSYYFRTRGINEMGGNIGSILGLYLIIYTFCVIIFTYLARNVVFIILETRTLLRKRKCSGISE